MIYLSEGNNFIVYLKDGNVKKILKDEIISGQTSRKLSLIEKEAIARTLVFYTKKISNIVGGNIIPIMTNLGRGELEQLYVDGKSIDQLSVESKKVALIEYKKLVDSLDEKIIISNWGVLKKWLLKIDFNIENFRYNDDGSVRGWFDPILIEPPK